MGKNLQVTFDDGPDPVRTALNDILSEIKSRRVKAAFFNLGQEVKASPAATKKIKDDGHVLGNHSWDHLMPRTSGYTDDQIEKQFSDTHAEVIAATSVTMEHWRAPRGEQISRLAGLLTGSGNLYSLSHCEWHADSKDAQGSTTAAPMLGCDQSRHRSPAFKDQFSSLVPRQTNHGIRSKGSTRWTRFRRSHHRRFHPDILAESWLASVRSLGDWHEGGSYRGGNIGVLIIK